MELDKSNSEMQILYVIDKDGKITSVPPEYGEADHYEPYCRLNSKLEKIYKKGTRENSTQILPILSEDYDMVETLPIKYAKAGFINVFPIIVGMWYLGFGVIFPKEKTSKQLQALKSLYIFWMNIL